MFQGSVFYRLYEIHESCAGGKVFHVVQHMFHICRMSSTPMFFLVWILSDSMTQGRVLYYLFEINESRARFKVSRVEYSIFVLSLPPMSYFLESLKEHDQKPRSLPSLWNYESCTRVHFSPSLIHHHCRLSNTKDFYLELLVRGSVLYRLHVHWLSFPESSTGHVSHLPNPSYPTLQNGFLTLTLMLMAESGHDCSSLQHTHLASPSLSFPPYLPPSHIQQLITAYAALNELRFCS